MKKYNTLFVVVIAVLVVAVLSWILPITYLNGELVEAERAQVGIMNLFSYPVFTFYNFIYIFVYLLSIGGLYGVLNKTGAYRLILDKVVNHVKKHQVLSLILTVLVLSAIISFAGFTFEALIVLPFIAGVVLLLGYDSMVAAMVTVGSVSVGVMGTTFSKTVSGTFNEILGTTYTDLIWVKTGLLLVLAFILIINILLYARKLEKNKNVEASFLVPEKVHEKTVKVWPLATILIVLLLVCVLSVIDWSGAFGLNIFDVATEKVLAFPVLSRYTLLGVGLIVVGYNIIRSIITKKKNTKKNAKKADSFMTKKRLIVTIVFGVIALVCLAKIVLEDIFNVTKVITEALDAIKLKGIIDGFTWGKLLGTVQAFGSWTYNDFVAVLLMTTIVIKIVYRIHFAEAISYYGEGLKKVLYAAIVALLAYTVLILISSHPIILTILKPILNLTDGLSILWYPIATFVSALCNTDFTYYKYGALTLDYATNYFTATNVYPLCGLITQSMYGLAILVAPTSSVLLFTLSILDVKYLTWLKKMWRPILEMVLVIFISYILVLQFLV